MSLDFQYEGLGTSEYRWMFKVCFFFANISTAIIGGDLYE
nr:MAG TPA: immunity protein [Bacteriophage sp.]